MKVKTRGLFLLTCAFLIMAGPLLGQSTTIIKEKKIATRTVQEYFVDEGMDEPVVESIERFNESGDVIEILTSQNQQPSAAKCWPIARASEADVGDMAVINIIINSIINILIFIATTIIFIIKTTKNYIIKFIYILN